ncbi:hypothetical protein JW890_04890 [candidate division WOR-3 bacterium]|nr:hypothetical protein [candidate division WOR-3 bacterium]
MSFENAIIFLGLILIVISLPHGIISFFEWLKEKKLLRSGKKTIAKIKDSVTYPKDDTVNTGQYRFIAEFCDEKGKVRYAKSKFASRSPESFMNKQVHVIYDEKDPEINRFLKDISGVRKVVEYALLFSLGIGSVLFGFLKKMYF